jgi:hypothetical protein
VQNRESSRLHREAIAGCFDVTAVLRSVEFVGFHPLELSALSIVLAVVFALVLDAHPIVVVAAPITAFCAAAIAVALLSARRLQQLSRNGYPTCPGDVVLWTSAGVVVCDRGPFGRSGRAHVRWSLPDGDVQRTEARILGKRAFRYRLGAGLSLRTIPGIPFDPFTAAARALACRQPRDRRA